MMCINLKVNTHEVYKSTDEHIPMMYINLKVSIYTISYRASGG